MLSPVEARTHWSSSIEIWYNTYAHIGAQFIGPAKGLDQSSSPVSRETPLTDGRTSWQPEPTFPPVPLTNQSLAIHAQ